MAKGGAARKGASRARSRKRGASQTGWRWEVLRAGAEGLVPPGRGGGARTAGTERVPVVPGGCGPEGQPGGGRPSRRYGWATTRAKPPRREPANRRPAGRTGEEAEPCSGTATTRTGTGEPTAPGSPGDAGKATARGETRVWLSRGSGGAEGRATGDMPRGSPGARAGGCARKVRRAARAAVTSWAPPATMLAARRASISRAASRQRQWTFRPAARTSRGLPPIRRRASSRASVTRPMYQFPLTSLQAREDACTVGSPGTTPQMRAERAEDRASLRARTRGEVHSLKSNGIESAWRASCRRPPDGATRPCTSAEQRGHLAEKRAPEGKRRPASSGE